VVDGQRSDHEETVGEAKVYHLGAGHDHDARPGLQEL